MFNSLEITTPLLQAKKLLIWEESTLSIFTTLSEIVLAISIETLLPTNIRIVFCYTFLNSFTIFKYSSFGSLANKI